MIHPAVASHVLFCNSGSFGFYFHQQKIYTKELQSNPHTNTTQIQKSQSKSQNPNGPSQNQQEKQKQILQGFKDIQPQILYALIIHPFTPLLPTYPLKTVVKCDKIPNGYTKICHQMAKQNDLINKQQHCISNYRQKTTTFYIKIIGKKDIPLITLVTLDNLYTLVILVTLDALVTLYKM